MKKNKLIKNSLIGLLQLILTAFLTLISVPIFLKKLGLELYGIFAIVSVVGSLNVLTSLGLNSALLVFVATHGKCKASDHAILVTQALMFIMLTVFIAVIVTFKSYIVSHLLAVPLQYSADSEVLLIYLAIANALLLMGQSYVAIIDALQKIHLTNISQFIYSLIYWGGILTVVSLGGGLVNIGMVTFGAATIWFILIYMQMRYLWGKLNLKGLKNDFITIAKQQLTYGTKLYVSGIIGLLFEPLSKILLSNLIGINAVALFEIAIKIKTQINGLFSKAVYPLLPFIANSNDNDDLKRKVYDLSKKIQLLVIPVTITITFILSILIKIWLGEQNNQQTIIYTICLSATVLLFSAPILPIYFYLSAKNQPSKTIWIQLSSVIVNTSIFISTYKIFGLYTILVSNTFGFFVSFCLGHYYQYKYLNIKLKEEYSYYLKLIILAVYITTICLLSRFYLAVSYWDLLIYPVIVGLLTILLIRILGLLTKNDISLYFNTLPYFENKLTKLLVA